MSRSVTTRTQTVTRSSFTINSGYLMTWSGILKLLELVCVLLLHFYFFIQVIT